MILLSYCNSSIKGTEIFGSILYLSLLRTAIFVCVLSGRKLIIFHFNSWLSFQRLCRLLRGYCIPLCITHRPIPTCQISLKSKKLLWTDGRTYGSTYRRVDIWDWLYLGRLWWRVDENNSKFRPQAGKINHSPTGTTTILMNKDTTSYRLSRRLHIHTKNYKRIPSLLLGTSWHRSFTHGQRTREDSEPRP